MKGEERRKQLLNILSSSNNPVSGGTLAKELNVSRQIIVQDISLLRANGATIFSTNKGYLLQEDRKYSRVFKVYHTDDQVEEELSTIVDAGGQIRDVFVYHKVYGVLKADMGIKSRRDIRAYMEEISTGKSSLLNRACPQLQLPVGEVSEKLGRGRHTTRHIELYSLGSNTFVADTPGFSAFDTERMELVHKEQLQYAFPEFAPYLGHCQFPDCAHRKEPGCAVRKALAEGKIGQTRYSSYERLYELASQLKEWELK